MKFGEGQYFIQCEDGTQTQGPLSHIHKAEILCGYYRFYLNKTNFYVIPVQGFCSEADRSRFETEILGDKLKPAAFPWRKAAIFAIFTVICIGFAVFAKNST